MGVVDRRPPADVRRVIATAPPITYDVFLSHNRADAPAVERLARGLRDAGLRIWLDAWCVAAGETWLDRAADGMDASRSCAVFLGPHDVGPWEKEELGLALVRSAQDPAFRVFLVVLPGVTAPSSHRLSAFLITRSGLDLRGVDERGAIEVLRRAVAGEPLHGSTAVAREPLRQPAQRRWLAPLAAIAMLGAGRAATTLRRE